MQRGWKRRSRTQRWDEMEMWTVIRMEKVTGTGMGMGKEKGMEC